MKHCMLLLLLLALGCMNIRAAPVDPDAMLEGSCEDASAMGAAKEALTKLNRDRKEGYVFSLRRLSNVHMKKHVSHTTQLQHLFLMQFVCQIEKLEAIIFLIFFQPDRFLIAHHISNLFNSSIKLTNQLRYNVTCLFC